MKREATGKKIKDEKQLPIWVKGDEAIEGFRGFKITAKGERNLQVTPNGQNFIFHHLPQIPNFICHPPLKRNGVLH